MSAEYYISWDAVQETLYYAVTVSSVRRDIKVISVRWIYGVLMVEGGPCD
jgi:hypothetical protein